MNKSNQIRGYMIDAGVPKKYWPMSLEVYSLDQPNVMAHIEKDHLTVNDGFCGVNFYPKQGTDPLFVRDVFLVFARELVLAGFSTKVYPLIGLVEAMEDNRNLARVDALHANQVLILDFASDGAVDGLTAQEIAKVQRYIMHRIDNRLGVSVHYPQTESKVAGTPFGYSSMLIHSLTMANYNETVYNSGEKLCPKG